MSDRNPCAWPVIQGRGSGHCRFRGANHEAITLPFNQLPIAKSIILPPGSKFVSVKESKDPENVNHCIEYSLYAGNCDNRTLRTKLHLLGQMTEEPYFNQLRTVEQLGYIASSGQIFHEAWAGYSIVIESERGCEYLGSRVDVFLVTFEQTLQKMTEEIFESHKNAVIRGLRENLVNLGQKDQRFWNYISNDSYDFLRGTLNSNTARTRF
jgi:insulysin